MEMKRVLRIITKKGSDQHKWLDNIANFVPRKGDHLTHKKVSYIVEWVEFDFDEAILYIVVME